jgi:hypothetical protein
LKPHVIRLRGPWHREPLVRDGPEDSRRPARYSRRFNRPTNLDPEESVWLVLEGVDVEAEIALNGRSLGKVGEASDTTRFEITAMLEAHNMLSIDIPLRLADNCVSPGNRELPAGEVRLEISRA